MSGDLAKLARDLKPFILPWLNGGGGGGGGAPPGVTDHGHLTGLGDDDHLQYLTPARGDARYLTAMRQVIAGAGLTGGGALTADVTLNVGAGLGLTVNANDVALATSVAGDGLTYSSGVLAVGAGSGLTVSADAVALTTPGSLSAASSNSAAGSHTHAIASSYDVSAASAETILKSNAAGGLTVNQLVAGGTGAKVRTPLIDTASGALTLDPAGDVVWLGDGSSLRTAHHTSATTGWGVTYAGAGDFRYLFADEMQVKVFTAVLEQAQAGRFMVAKSVAEMAYSFTAPAPGNGTYLYVRDLPGAPDMAVFESGDIVSVHTFSRSGGGLTITSCYGQVGNVSGDTGPGGAESGVQRWDFLRSAGTVGGGNAPGAMTAGTVVDANGSLAIDWGQTSGGYVETIAVDGPYNARNSPYMQVVTWTGHPNTGRQTRVRLGNLRGITGSTEYGLWAGDATNGNIIVTGEGVKLRQGTTDKIVLSGTAGDSYFAGVMTIGTSGEIRQGTGAATFTPGNGNFVGLRIWRESNVGLIGGYGAAAGGATGGYQHWYGSTDGKFYFARGGGSLSYDGIALAAPESIGGAGDPYLSYGFTNPGGLFAKLDAAWTTAGTPTDYLTLSVGKGNPAARPRLQMWATGNATYPGIAELQAVGASTLTLLLDAVNERATLTAGAINMTGSTTLTGTFQVTQAVTAGGANFSNTVTLTNASPLLSVGSSSVTTGTAAVNIGVGRAGDGSAVLRLSGSSSDSNYGAALLRNSGVNGATQFLHQGTGNLDFAAVNAATFRVLTNNARRIEVLSTGEVGIGKTPTSGVELDVSGDILASGTVTGTLTAVAGSAPTMTQDTGVLGEMRWDTFYLYLKVSNTGNRWRRIPLNTY